MLRVPYIFVCEGIDFNNNDQNITISNMFDMKTIKKSPSILRDLQLVFGVIGEEEDHKKELILKIRGKEFKTSLPALTYNFNGYDQITLFHGSLGSLPVSNGETVYFVIEYKGNTISEYPVKFKLEEEVEL